MSVQEAQARFKDQMQRINELSERVEKQIQEISTLTVPNRRLNAYAPHVALICAIVLMLVLLSQRSI